MLNGFNFQILFVLLILVSFSLPSQQFLVTPSSQQSFRLRNRVTTLDPHYQSKQSTSFTLEATLDITSVWDYLSSQILKVVILNPQVSVASKKHANLKFDVPHITEKPFYVSLIDRKLHKVLGHVSNDLAMQNLQKAIASLFVIQEEIGYKHEIDISGECKNLYEKPSRLVIEKTKSECSLWEKKLNPDASRFPSILQESQASITYQMDEDGTLISAFSNESHLFTLTASPTVGILVQSELTMQWQSSSSNKAKQFNQKSFDSAFKSLLRDYNILEREASEDHQMKDFIIKYTPEERDFEQYTSQTERALYFASLVPYARTLSKSDFLEMLKSQRQKADLMDLMGAAQTFEAYKAVNEFVNMSRKSDSGLWSKYLLSLAVGQQVEIQVIQSLFEMLKKSQLKTNPLYATLLHTVASVTHKTQTDDRHSLKQEVLHFIKENFNKCKLSDCKTMFIRSLQNLQDITSVAFLIDLSMSKDNRISVAALEALQAFHPSSFYPNELSLLGKIFFQIPHKFDSTARTLALEILFASQLCYQDLGDLLDYMSHQSHEKEMVAYLGHKINSIAEEQPEFKVMLKKALLERPYVFNYDTLATKGRAMAFQTKISQTPFFNTTWSFKEEVYQGFLKRGTVEMFLTAGNLKNTHTNMILSSSGIGSYIRSKRKDESSPVSVSIDISFQGTVYQPMILVTSMGELLFHIWKGTVSQPTPITNRNILEDDFEHSLVLSSGATVHFNLIGVRSLDMIGRFRLSLWRKKGESEMFYSFGKAFVGQMVAGFNYAQVESKFVVSNGFDANLLLDCDFTKKIIICARLELSEMSQNTSTTRSVVVNVKKNYCKRVHRNQVFKLPGKSIFVDHINNKVCRKILK